MKQPVLVAMPLSVGLRRNLETKYDVFTPLDRGNSLPTANAGKARALITLGGLVTDAALMDQLPELGLICCYGTGFEGVDRHAAAKRGIAVTHAGDSNATAVAEFAMGLVIAAARNIVRGDKMLRAGKWQTHPIDGIPTMPGLAGKRLGIYGMGTIGLKIARRAEAFEMDVGYFNRSQREDVGYSYFDGLESLALWSDVLVVAVRAGAGNRHAINASILKALGSEGVLVNISRGLVVDEDALCDALESKGILSAALDVYENEPCVPDRLRALENVVLTPHIAAFSRAAQAAQLNMMLGNLEAFFSGGKLRSVVPSP